MATTYSIDRVAGTPADYSMKKLSETDISFQSTEVLPDGGIRTTYTIASGDGNYPTTIVFVTKANPKANGGHGTRSATIALNTFARAAFDDGTEKISPVSCAMHFNVPLDVLCEVDDLRDMVEALYSLSYASLNTKEPETTRLSKLVLFGVTEIL